MPSRSRPAGPLPSKSPRTPKTRSLTGHLQVRATGRYFVPDAADPANAPYLDELEFPRDARFALVAGPDPGWNGDKVRASLTLSHGEAVPPQPARRGLTPRDLRARVSEVLVHRFTSIPGTLRLHRKGARLEPNDELLPVIDVMLNPEVAAQDGDKVVVEIQEWPKLGGMHRGYLTKRLGRDGEAGVDVLGILYKFKLPLEFPEDVQREAEAIPVAISPEELARREDWRGQHVITIDPFDARDFDDAIAVKELAGGGWELGVHIADVAHYVTPGSALDREARARGNSTYLVDRVIPMLPERLSNGLCSLRPQEEKLTRVAVMEFDAKGRMTKARFARAVICSAHRYTYEEAMAVLQSPPGDDVNAQLVHRSWGLASLLRKHRYEQGALDLDFPEVKCVIDKVTGKPLRLTKMENDESHQLIEECMLAANQAVAKALVQGEHPALYRIHEEPDAEKLADYRALLLAHGIKVGDLTKRRELQKAIAAMTGRAEAPALKMGLLRSLKRAVYSPDSLGHFGLAMPHYTHFTSPIRRYADLVVHRVLDTLDPAVAAQARTPGAAALKELAESISTTERNSADAEIESKRLKELEYFSDLSEQPEPPVFPATVTRVLRVGVMVELDGLMVRGFVPMADAGLKGARYDGAREHFMTPSGKVWAVGTALSVAPAGIEKDRGNVLFRTLAKVRTNKPGKSRIKLNPLR